MNILMVHPHNLFDSSEPWAVRIVKLAEMIKNSGHNVRLCYFSYYIRSKHPASFTKKGLELFPLERSMNPWVFIKNTNRLMQLAQWADIIHLQKCHHYASVPAVVAAYIAKKPLHYDWDDWEEKIWYESCGRNLYTKFIGLSFKLLERWLPVLADSVSCASKQLKVLSEKFGVKKEFIFDAPVGADREEFNLNVKGQQLRKKYGMNSRLILYVGQLHGAQYVSLLLRAANIVIHKRPDARFLIVGKGFMMEKLKRLAFDLGIEDKVIFTGAVNHQEIPSYIAAADVCVAPFADTEVTRCKSPLKIAEYIAMGKIVVASCVGEVRNMLGGCGVLVEPGSYHKLAEGIVWALDNKPSIAEKVKHRARRRGEKKYNWEYTARNLIEAYNKIKSRYETQN